MKYNESDDRLFCDSDSEPRILTVKVRKSNYFVDIFPTVRIELEKKPSLWVRFGMFIWFGLRVKEIK